MSPQQLESIQRASDIVDTLSEYCPLLRLSVDGFIMDGDPAFFSRLGYHAADLAGKSIRQLVDPDELDEEFDYWWRCISQGKHYSSDCLFYLQNGATKYLHTSFLPHLDEKNQHVDSVLCIACEITNNSHKAIEDNAKIKAINATQCVAEFTPDGYVIAANSFFLELMGYNKNEVHGQHHQIFCDTDVVNTPEYVHFWQQLASGHAQSGEFKRKTKAGEWVWMQAVYTPVHDQEGKVYKIIKLGRDVTAAKQKSLQEEAIQRALNACMAQAEFDMQGNLLAWNPMFQQVMGYTQHQLLGKNHRNFLPEQDVESGAYQQFWQDLRAGDTVQGDFCRLNAKGQVVWLQATYTPVIGLDGLPCKVLKFAADITAAKLKALEDDRKVAAIENSQGVIEFDMQGHILRANDNFLQLTGYTLDELKGQHHRIFMDKHEAQTASYRAFWAKLNRGEYDEGEYLRFTKKGERIYLRATYNPMFDLQGNPFKVVKYCADVTAEKLERLAVEAQLTAVSGSSCILDVDRHGVIRDVNPLMEKALGYSRVDLIGKSDAILLFEDDANSEQHKRMWSKLREGVSVHEEIRRKGALGEVWFSAILCPVMGLDGAVVRVIAICEDITQDKISRLDAAGKLTAIQRSQAVIEFDLNGKVLDANSNFLDLMGYRLEDIQGMHHRMFLTHEDTLSADYQMFWDKLSRGEFQTGEFKRMARGGREVWIQATYNPVFDYNGRPLKVVKFATDVTEQKMRNAEFEAKVQAIDLGQAVIEFDLTGNIITANRNFLTSMGYTLREIVGHHHSIFCTSEYTHSEEYRSFWQRLGEGEFISGRFHRVGKFNRDVWIQATYNPIRDLNGAVVKIVKYAYDVTKEVKLEQSIVQKSMEMAKFLTELHHGVLEISSLSEHAKTSTDAMSTAANAGGDAVEQSRQSIQQVERGIQKVAEIVRVVGDISNQTNLLAFNAAIEAARAGQHGVGFSVVASEVRKLAERSAQAAREIGQLIEQALHQVEHGMQVSQDTLQRFAVIRQSVEQADGQVNAIARMTTTQTANASAVQLLIESLSQSVKG